MVIADTSDSNKKKKALISDITALGGGVFTKSYASSAQTFAAGSTYTLSHGLGVFPQMVYAYAVCVTAEKGYATGDRVELGAFSLTNEAKSYGGLNIRTTSSYICIDTPLDAGIFRDRTGSYPNLGVSVHWANWRFYIQAYA